MDTDTIVIETKVEYKTGREFETIEKFETFDRDGDPNGSFSKKFLCVVKDDKAYGLSLDEKDVVVEITESNCKDYQFYMLDTLETINDYYLYRDSFEDEFEILTAEELEWKMSDKIEDTHNCSVENGKVVIEKYYDARVNAKGEIKEIEIRFNSIAKPFQMEAYNTSTSYENYLKAGEYPKLKLIKGFLER